MRALIRIATVLASFMVVGAAGANALSDPTRPMGVVAGSARPAAKAPAAPVLQSTMVSPNHKSAIISGRQVRVGDTVQGAVITDITPYEVTMNKGGRRTTLRLHPKLIHETGGLE